MTTPHHKTTASGTSAPLLPAAMSTAAPAPSSSPSSAPQQLGSERRTVTTSLEVYRDWSDPVTPGRKRSMADIMRRSRVVDAPEYTYYATLLCETCGSGEREEDMLICDFCNRGHHTFCLRPMATQVPIGPWFCPVCATPPGFPPKQNEISNTFEIQKDEQADGDQASESRVSQDFLPHREREDEIETTLHHKMTAPGTSAPVLPAATPAPSSSPSSPQIGSKSKVVTSLEVKLDWGHPVMPRPKRSMGDIMRHARVVDAPPPVARAAEYTYYATLLCETCGSGDREEDMPICDFCNRGHHTFCLRPMATQVPIGPWFCSVCATPPGFPAVNQNEISNSFEIIQNDDLPDADQTAESRVSQDFLPHREREDEIETTMHHKMTAPGTSAPALPAATPAPSSSPSSPQIGSKSKVVTSLEVKLDWGHPVMPRPKRSMGDIMRHARVVDAPPPVAHAAEYTYYATLLCETCGSGDHDEELLLCDGCNRGHHTFCLQQIATEVLVGPWFCPVCAPPATDPNSIPLNQTKISNSFNIQKDEQLADQAAESRVSQGFPPNQIKISTFFGIQKGEQDANQGAESRVSQVDTTKEASGELFNKFLATRAFRKGYKIEGHSQSPPFIEISDFYVTYDEFYDSFKARGLVSNNVMTLWCNQFNLDQLQLFEEKKTTYRKFAFSQIITDYLAVIPDSFNHEKSCKKIYTKINKTFPFNKMHLVFFPIVSENHWVLLCVNMSMKQIAFFDSLSASKGTKSLKRLNRAENLILNFAATTIKYGFLEDDVSQFERIPPLGYPKQKNLVDCGMYTMDYMEAWNGNEMVASSLEKGTVLEYRKHAGLLLESVDNKIKLDDFVKKYNGKET